MMNYMCLSAFLLFLLLQGTAGFGIGKGANEAVAVKKALRAARRDLIFVDRYKVISNLSINLNLSVVYLYYITH